MAAAQPNFEAEASALRKLARAIGTRFAFRKHALAEYAKDKVSRIDVEVMLGRCRITLIEDRKGEETWRAEGADCDGRTIVAVVVCKAEESEIKIITGWAIG